MGKLFVTLFSSLDGVIENPTWTIAYWNDEIAAFKGQEFAGTQALLLGRVTYEGFAAVWPSRGPEEGGEEMNNLPKYVVTSTLKDLSWNNSHRLGPDLRAEVLKLKAQYSGDVQVTGSARLAGTLIEMGLVDALHLLVYPEVLGEGQRLFTEGMKVKFTLLEARPMGQATLLRYGPAGS